MLLRNFSSTFPLCYQKIHIQNSQRIVSTNLCGKLSLELFASVELRGKSDFNQHRDSRVTSSSSNSSRINNGTSGWFRVNTRAPIQHYATLWHSSTAASTEKLTWKRRGCEYAVVWWWKARSRSTRAVCSLLQQLNKLA